MTDQLLGILKIALLALLYLFFARVLWTVWTEVRGPRGGHVPVTAPGATPRPAGPPPSKGRRGVVGRLVVIEPKQRKGQAYAVHQEMTMGRSEGCTMSIPDDTFMSQVHARVFVSDGKVYVEDLASTNGSYLNGNRLTATQPLRRGDRLQVGNTVLEAQ
jgi:pSer/pThr/pTyr-binding forkhead associated (FHA) protein